MKHLLFDFKFYKWKTKTVRKQLKHITTKTHLLDETKVYQNIFTLLGDSVLSYKCHILDLKRFLSKVKIFFSHKVTCK